MSDKKNFQPFQNGIETLLTHGGRDPGAQHGFVNTPVFRGSTIVFDTLDALEDATTRYRYGRHGTPLTTGLEEVVSDLEGAAGTVITPSGVSAISVALLSCLSSGDEVLITDSVYEPTRQLAVSLLDRMGIKSRFFDPAVGAGIADLVGPDTRAVFLESPGSLTFEIQDIPTITDAVKNRGITVLVDNSWATPLFLQPLALGADIVIHSGTKMFAGHSDAMIGTASANEKALGALKKTYRALGIAVGPDDAFLTARGIRTLAIRMREHERRALELAEWLRNHDGVTQVFHPALPDHPGHDVYVRDFSGSGSLFSFVLPAAPRQSVAAFVDGLELFGMGYSWGGFESLILPANPKRIRTATQWTESGHLFRIHVGFEDLDALKQDLAAGMDRYFNSLGT